MTSQSHARQTDGIGGERRTDRRYQIPLDLRWKLIRRRKVLHNGDGITVDLSSGGILFDARRSLPVGLDVELSISWPVLLNDVAAMQLVVSGRIVRSTGTTVAIRMTQHEFRTLASHLDSRPRTSSGRGPVLVSGGRGLGSYETLH